LAFGSACCALQAWLLSVQPLPQTLGGFGVSLAIACLLFPIAQHCPSPQIFATPIVFVIYCSGVSYLSAAAAGLNDVIAAHYQLHAGVLNGIVGIVDALAKSCGPALFPPIFAVGLHSRPFGTSLGVPLVWAGFAALALALAFAGLRARVEMPPGEAEDEGAGVEAEGFAAMMLRISTIVRAKRVARRVRDKVRLASIEYCVHTVSAGLDSTREEESGPVEGA